MVIFTDWLLSPVIPRSTCGLSMAGEDTGLEAVASPMVGYLGKVQERAASLDQCPWCCSKGLTYPLRSYRINLEESITLCTNPQCLFPLVSRPLEDVLSSLVLVEPATEDDRNKPLTLVDDKPSPSSPKRLSLEDDLSKTSSPTDGSLHTSVVDPREGPLDACETRPLEFQLNSRILGNNLDSCTDAQNISLDKADKVENASKTLHTIDSQEESSQGSERDGENHCTNTVSLDGISSLPDGDVSPPPAQTEATIEPMLSAENTVALTDYVVNSEIKDISPEEKLVPAPVEIFWRNKKNLCWLDSLLVALVNLKSLRNLKPPAEPQQSPVWRVLSTCDEANAAIQSQQQPDKDGSMKVPRQLLKTVNTTLETLRMSVFDLLQPKLQCKLGQKESPVFALPLLLKLDPWLESSFQASFRWDFRCSSCKSSTRENLVKTLPSFTNIVPDWHPLRASHLAPCNNCHQKNQRRRMVLQGASPVFVLHFVEGLPDNNIQVYNFNFKKRHYSVTAVIQYSSHQEHFVTWVHRSDGSWLEFDDLKHPHCTSHQTFPVPAQEIHIVFWEEEQRQESRACSPSSTSTETPLSTNRIHPSVKDLDNIAQELFQSSPDQSLLHPQNTSDIVDGISEQDASIMAEVDTTIGSTTLLETFEGLSHNDIVTLTLVDISEDSKKLGLNSTILGSNSTNAEKVVKIVNGEDVDEKTQDLIDISAPAPDSSTIEAVKTPANVKSQAMDLCLSQSDDNLSEPDNTADDPTYKPKFKAGKRPRETVRQNKRTKIDPANKVARALTSTPTQRKSTPAQKPTSLVSSTVPSPPSFSPTPSPIQQDQNCWSNLLERSLGHVTNAQKMNPNQSTKEIWRKSPVNLPPPPKAPSHDKVKLKPLLRTEHNLGLPLKAAEMYGGFGSKNLKPNPAPVIANKQPIEPPVKAFTSLGNNPNGSIVGLTNDVVSSRKTKSSKTPSGLSDTEALRYKLLKKLKAKKKKLAQLNEMLGEARPDSTNAFSPGSVTSSTLDDEFLSDLFSPATTVTSTRSPDSTDFLEMLANGQEASVSMEMSQSTQMQQNTGMETNDFLDEFMSQAVAERPGEMEEDPLMELGLFL
ncbi:unnamed protein product [Knipowitschia caucasica]